MRQKLSDRKARLLADKLGLPVVSVWARGNSEHRVLLCLDGGLTALYDPHTGAVEKSDQPWPDPLVDETPSVKELTLAEYQAIMGNCEVCGAPAVSLVNDAIEVTPPSESVREYMPIGEMHRFCQAHNRESIEYWVSR
jgi:hypothetical protein